MFIKKYSVFIWFTVITLCGSSCKAQDLSSSAQRYKPNLDFLQHEGGTPPPKRDYVAQFPPLPSKSVPGSSPSTPGINGNLKSTGKRDYVASDFPPLKPSTLNHNNDHHSTANPTSSTLSQQSNGKRDYIAQDFPPLKPPANNNKGHTTSPTSATTNINTQKNNARRDYVAPQVTTPIIPHLTPSADSHNNGHTASPTTATTKKNTQQTNSRRDYVAPQFTTPVPGSTSNTKVKDLINFFGGSNDNKKPSYSSKVGGGQNTPSTMRINQPVPTSSSTIGINKQGTTIASSAWTNGHQTTAKPTTRVPLKPLVPTTNTRNPATQRPVSTLMPSSFVNNKNDQRNGPTDIEIESLSEELLRKDSNNAAKLITVNIQERTSSQSKDDKAPQPLFVIPDKVWSMPTIQKFVPLLDNYERDTTVNEYVTPQEKNEENAFMDAIMSTAVIRHLMNFFKEKGYVTPDPRQQRDFLKQLWFSLYARSRGKLSSSGFEHIFVSELKNNEVSGLHNWIYFSKEEAAHRMNYLGHLKYLQLNDKGAIIKLHFNQQGADKPVDTMFIGTSPELEVALYTLCFVTRADKDCKLKLAGKDVNIVTHTFRYRSKNLIGSAYPQF